MTQPLAMSLRTKAMAMLFSAKFCNIDADARSGEEPSEPSSGAMVWSSGTIGERSQAYESSTEPASTVNKALFLMKSLLFLG